MTNQAQDDTPADEHYSMLVLLQATFGEHTIYAIGLNRGEIEAFFGTIACVTGKDGKEPGVKSVLAHTFGEGLASRGR